MIGGGGNKRVNSEHMVKKKRQRGMADQVSHLLHAKSATGIQQHVQFQKTINLAYIIQLPVEESLPYLYCTKIVAWGQSR